MAEAKFTKPKFRQLPIIVSVVPVLPGVFFVASGRGARLFNIMRIIGLHRKVPSWAEVLFAAPIMPHYDLNIAWGLFFRVCLFCLKGGAALCLLAFYPYKSTKRKKQKQCAASARGKKHDGK